MSSPRTPSTKLRAHQHLQISHNLRKASGRVAPPLKSKLMQMANTHLARTRLEAKAQTERLSAKARVAALLAGVTPTAGLPVK